MFCTSPFDNSHEKHITRCRVYAKVSSKKWDFNILFTNILSISMSIIEPDSRHISVLLDELVDSIKIFEDRKNIVVDCTLWLAWHACKIIQKMKPWDLFVWFDADTRNLALAKEKLSFLHSEVEIILIHSNFSELKSKLAEHWITSITGIYYDLWISSLHVDDADRWFSFRANGPLDMRFDASTWKTAADIINYSSKDELEEIIRYYWEEASFRKIADRIIQRRKQEKFTTTADLANFIDEISNYPKTKTKVFQAFRIAVNAELESIKVSITDAIDMLESQGNIFVISFHSLEDRITKQLLKIETRDCICSDLICTCHHTKRLRLHTKKPILPSQKEIDENSRSKSAKARGAMKL